MQMINTLAMNPLVALSMANAVDSNSTAMMESAAQKKKTEEERLEAEKQQQKKPASKKSKSKKAAMLEAVAARAGQDDRALAASLVTGWATDGSPDADDFDALAINMAGLGDLDPEADLTDDQINAYNDALGSLADAAVSLGADQDDVTSMIDDDDDDAAERVYDAISGNSDNDDDADDAIAQYSVSGDSDDDGNAMMESSTIKVVRNGEVKLIHKRLRPRRMTSLQKAALKKAQMRAHSASSNMARRKSMKIRVKRGL